MGFAERGKIEEKDTSISPSPTPIPCPIHPHLKKKEEENTPPLPPSKVQCWQHYIYNSYNTCPPIQKHLHSSTTKAHELNSIIQHL